MPIKFILVEALFFEALSLHSFVPYYLTSTNSSLKMSTVEYTDTTLKCVFQKGASTGTTAFGIVQTLLSRMNRGILSQTTIRSAVKTAPAS